MTFLRFCFRGTILGEEAERPLYEAIVALELGADAGASSARAAPSTARRWC